MLKTRKPVFFENLDALRGIAFGMVFLYHFFGYMPYTSSGYFEKNFIAHVIMEGHLGVNLFFVLSGFLITYLLLVEKEENSKINIKFFYVRRILRIWPLYFLVILISFFIYPIVTHQFSFSVVKDHWLYYLFFINNFDRILTGFNGLGNDNLGVLWSIAIEEQFYLFWPLILFIANKKYYLPLFFLIIIASLTYRFFYINDETRLYLHTFSVMSDLAIGGALAYFCLYKTKIFYAIVNCKRSFIILIYILFGLAIIFLQKWSLLNALTHMSERLILSFFFAFIIAEQCFAKNSFFKLGKLKILSWMGTISYGLYCLHLYGIAIIQKLNVAMGCVEIPKILFYVELISCLGISILLAYLSYTFFEKKILRFKTKFVTVLCK